MKNIIVEPIAGGRSRAYWDGPVSYAHACGQNDAEAIGNLYLLFPTTMGVAIDLRPAQPELVGARAQEAWQIP